MQNPTVKKEKKLTDLHPQDEQSVRENNTQVQHELQGGVQITNGWVNVQWLFAKQKETTHSSGSCRSRTFPNNSSLCNEVWHTIMMLLGKHLPMMEWQMGGELFFLVGPIMGQTSSAHVQYGEDLLPTSC